MTESQAINAEGFKDFSANNLISRMTSVPGLEETHAYYKHFTELHERSASDANADMYAEAGIDSKTLELIVVACLAVRGYRTGVLNHTMLALKAGNTPKEIRGAILITLATGGWAAMMPGLAWVDEILVPYENGEMELDIL